MTLTDQHALLPSAKAYGQHVVRGGGRFKKMTANINMSLRQSVSHKWINGDHLNEAFSNELLEVYADVESLLFDTNVKQD